MSNLVNVTVTSSGVAVVAPQDCAAVIVQQAQGSDPPSTAYSVYSDSALTNKIADVNPGVGYVFAPNGLPGQAAFANGQTLGYLKVASGTFTFTVGVVPLVMNQGGRVNSLLLGGPQQEKIGQVVTITGATALAITAKASVVILNSGTAATGLTIADPIAGTDDGKLLRIVDIQGKANVITDATSGFNGKGSSGTLTWATAIGNGVTLLAYNGKWYVIANIGVTVA